MEERTSAVDDDDRLTAGRGGRGWEGREGMEEVSQVVAWVQHVPLDLTAWRVIDLRSRDRKD